MKELSFADWARESVCRGDDIPELNNAYVALDSVVAVRQGSYAREFAEGLADWSAVGSTSIGVIGVEHVLENVVTKVIAEKNNVRSLIVYLSSWANTNALKIYKSNIQKDRIASVYLKVIEN